ncbi:unnamed protein product [Hymenolepis diminuta]|uniref:Ubiquitin-like protease family profile domain-containing protein n=3 Tax=Hymenolepis diminuta TaxID=6216 RepID=A0A564YYQ0_HYMDI|nr:unnamed protein product [Hymenolepis diminuta]
MLHDPHDQTANNKSMSESCSAFGRQYSSAVTDAAQIASEGTRVEQIGNKKRIVDVTSNLSSSGGMVYPMDLLTIGKAQLFDGKNQVCSITSKCISLCVQTSGGFVNIGINANEVEEILFCEPLRIIFFSLREACMNRITSVLGVTLIKDVGRKTRVVVVLAERPLRDPYECSVEPRYITALQLEGFCTCVRVSGGLAMNDIKPATAQSILTSYGLRLNLPQSANEAKQEPISVISSEALGPSIPESEPVPFPNPPVLSAPTLVQSISNVAEVVSLCDDSDDECNDVVKAAPSVVCNRRVTPSPERAAANGTRNSIGFNYRPPGSKDSIFLTYADIECLAPGMFVNDTIINFYLKYLYFEQFSDQQRHSTHLFNSFFYSRLCAAHPETNSNDEEREVVMARHKAVATWTRRSDIFTKDYIIIPINENLHWFLGLVCYPWMVGMVSYNKLYSEYNYDQCQLVPDFADTTFDPNVGDVGNEEIKVLSTDSQGEAFNRWRRRRLAWLRKRGINAMPCILLFDSLASQHRVGNLHKIRSYLQAEWDVRRSERDGEMIFNKDTIRGFSPRVPGQGNLVDCGIFLLHYVEMFFKRPVKSYTREYFQNEMSRWFESDMLGKKRSVINKLIDQLSRRTGAQRDASEGPQ